MGDRRGSKRRSTPKRGARRVASGAPSMARFPPTRMEAEGASERTIRAMALRYGLATGDESHASRLAAITRYFGATTNKRPAEGECATPSTAHVDGRARGGATPAEIRGLPAPMDADSTAGAHGEQAPSFGGEEARRQRQFAAAMEAADPRSREGAETVAEASPQAGRSGPEGTAWTAPPCPFFKRRGTILAPPPLLAGPRPRPLRPRRRADPPTTPLRRTGRAPSAW